jgi:hypothetical protein
MRSVVPIATSTTISGVRCRRPRERKLDGGVDEEDAERVKDPGEAVDGRGTCGDEQPAQQQGEDDPNQQDLLLIFARHTETRQYDDEHEQVVDRQAVLGHPACVEGARGTASPFPEDERAEGHSKCHIHRDPDRRLSHRRFMGPAGLRATIARSNISIAPRPIRVTVQDQAVIDNAGYLSSNGCPMTMTDASTRQRDPAEDRRVLLCAVLGGCQS